MPCVVMRMSCNNCALFSEAGVFVLECCTVGTAVLHTHTHTHTHTQTMDDHMSKIRKDGNSLINPKFAPSETEENMHSATKQAIETVKAKLTDLSETYHDLMSMCQQKRDLFIVCVKFHMTSRQVR